jgi:NADPH-dependent 2,4-dienoyl-CoA reductase/sulfur reductase-like enzyme
VLVGAEDSAPYERPHLSKGYLLGTVPRERLPLRPAHQYREMGIELMLGQRVVDLGLERRSIELQSGATIAWDRLCIATGSDARRLAGFDDAIYLRELPQAEPLRNRIDRGESLEIVGAGFIGCEVAAVAATRGCAVRVHEALDQPLVRVLGPELGRYLATVHAGHGVDLHLNVAALPRFTTAPLVAVGSVPRTELAERARLKVEGGIVVDERGRTSEPDVFAAGDATRFFSPLHETHIRVEHFQTAHRQGFAVGRSMAGATQAYA